MPRSNFYDYLTAELSGSALNTSPVDSQLFQLSISVNKSISASRIHYGRAALIEHFCAQNKQYFLLPGICRMKVILDTSHLRTDGSVMAMRGYPQLSKVEVVADNRKEMLVRAYFFLM